MPAKRKLTHDEHVEVAWRLATLKQQAIDLASFLSGRVNVQPIDQVLRLKDRVLGFEMKFERQWYAEGHDRDGNLTPYSGARSKTPPRIVRAVDG